MSEIEMPDGTKRRYRARSIEELKRLIRQEFGVAPEEFTIVDNDFTPRDDFERPPSQGKYVPKGVWGIACARRVIEDNKRSRIER